MINKGDRVTITLRLEDEAGKIWDERTTQNPFVYTHGQNQMMRFVEDELTGKQEGDKISLTIPPEKGYGLRDEKLIQALPKEHFKDVPNLSVGMQFNPSLDPNISFVVVDINDEKVTIDGNHPLADLTLTFGIQILKVESS